MTKLKELDLSGNPLTQLSLEIKNLPGLRVIDSLDPVLLAFTLDKGGNPILSE